MSTRSIASLNVATPQGHSGVLAHADSTYYFQYSPAAEVAAEISLTMPRRAQQYRNGSDRLFPLFEMSLPEGYVLEQLRNRFAKATHFDPMLLLALTGQDAAIGRVAVDTPQIAPAASDQGLRLETILAWQGTEDLFDALTHRYLQRTGISGVQPKLLVPEQADDIHAHAVARDTAHGKESLATRDLIVKAADAKFPGLALNEFICMSMARKAGIPVPDFYLSDNRQLFVMRRFDRSAEGRALGFEEMGVLMGKSAADKYKGSYAQVAKAVRLYAAPEYVDQGLAQLFDQVALSIIVGNGDAHLKNFGMLYSDPSANDVHMAPAYDIVNTTRYVPEDGLALSLNGSRNLFLAHVDIADFGATCNVTDPIDRIRKILDAAETTLDDYAPLLEDEPELVSAIRHGVERVRRGCDTAPRSR